MYQNHHEKVPSPILHASQHRVYEVSTCLHVCIWNIIVEKQKIVYYAPDLWINFSFVPIEVSIDSKDHFYLWFLVMNKFYLCSNKSYHRKAFFVHLLQITAGDDDNGLRLYDPGYLNTAPVRSSISYIDGDRGILRYRGYPIEELAERSTFPEVAYLLSKFGRAWEIILARASLFHACDTILFFFLSEKCMDRCPQRINYHTGKWWLHNILLYQKVYWYVLRSLL